MIISSMVDLARALGVQGRMEEVETLLRACVGWHEEWRGMQFQERRDVVWLLARVLEKRGNLCEAVGLYGRCYGGAFRVVGEHHVDTREYLRSRGF